MAALITILDIELKTLPETLQRKASQVVSQRKNASCLAYQWKSNERVGFLVRFIGADNRYVIVTEEGNEKVNLVPGSGNIKSYVTHYLDKRPGIL